VIIQKKTRIPEHEVPGIFFTRSQLDVLRDKNKKDPMAQQGIRDLVDVSP
jgi:hypothetical protein